MSGHNRWSKIKRTKGAADAKRGKIFTKLLREIQVAARIAGGDPQGNPRLRDAIAEARSHSMPKDNIERAIRKGCGELDSDQNYENVTYEGYGPAGVALLIECLTDNRNRTVADLRAIMVRNNGNLGEAGSVNWMFSKKGIISLPKTALEDQLMETALETGAEDIRDLDETWEIVTPPEDFEKVRSALEGQGMAVESAELTLLPQNTIQLEGEPAEQMLKLLELLEDLDDVQKIYFNFDLSDREAARLGN